MSMGHLLNIRVEHPRLDSVADSIYSSMVKIVEDVS